MCDPTLTRKEQTRQIERVLDVPDPDLVIIEAMKHVSGFSAVSCTFSKAQIKRIDWGESVAALQDLVVFKGEAVVVKEEEAEEATRLEMVKRR
eukprot:1143678-Rhodomonas_salina.1